MAAVTYIFQLGNTELPFTHPLVREHFPQGTPNHDPSRTHIPARQHFPQVTPNRGPITLITIRKRFYMVPLIHGPGHAYSRKETLFLWGTLNHGSRYTHIPVGKHFLQGTLNHGHRHLPDREHHPGGLRRGVGGVGGPYHTYFSKGKVIFQPHKHCFCNLQSAKQTLSCSPTKNISNNLLQSLVHSLSPQQRELQSFVVCH